MVYHLKKIKCYHLNEQLLSKHSVEAGILLDVNGDFLNILCPFIEDKTCKINEDFCYLKKGFYNE